MIDWLDDFDLPSAVLVVSIIGLSSERTWEWVAAFSVACTAFIVKQGMLYVRQAKLEAEHARIKSLEDALAKDFQAISTQVDAFEKKLAEINVTLSVMSMRR